MADLVGVIVEKAVEATVGAAIDAATHFEQHQSTPSISTDPSLSSSVVVKVDGEAGTVSDLDVEVQSGKVATKLKGEGRFEVSVRVENRIENPPPVTGAVPSFLVAENAPRNWIFSAHALRLSLHGVMAVGTFASAALSSSPTFAYLFAAIGTGTVMSVYFTRNMCSTQSASSQSASSQSAEVEDPSIDGAGDVESPSPYYCESHSMSFSNFEKLAYHYGESHTDDFITGCFTCERVFSSIEETIHHEETTEHITKRLVAEARWWN